MKPWPLHKVNSKFYAGPTVYVKLENRVAADTDQVEQKIYVNRTCFISQSGVTE